MEIKAGDIVQLKTGGPRMTVEWSVQGSAGCTWFDANNEHKTVTIKLAALQKVG